jgi:threonine dehydratase
MPRDYLEEILRATVYDVAVEAPLELAPGLSRRLDNRLLLKREDLQPIFSFKLRGAYNKMVRLPPAALRRGVIAASAGNHAQGVALAAQRLGSPATIVMPVTTPQIKVDAVSALGATVVLEGDSYDDAYARATTLAARKRLTFVHPYDDPDVIAGQGTIGMEVLRQCPGPIHAVFVPVGGGGLIGGIAAYVKRLRPDIRVIGVEPEDANAMERSLRAGRRVTLPQIGLFADGVAVKQVGRETFRLARRYVDEMILVDTDELCAAIKDVFEDTRSIAEPAGVLGVAGAKRYAEERGLKDETLVAVLSGANVNFDRLRFVAERADLGEQREAVFAELRDYCRTDTLALVRVCEVLQTHVRRQEISPVRC